MTEIKQVCIKSQRVGGGSAGQKYEVKCYTQLFARPDLKQSRTVDASPGHGIGIVKNGQLIFTSQITMQDQYLVSLKCYEMVGGPFKGILDVYQKHWDKYGKPVFQKGEQKLNRFTWEDLRK